MAPGTGFEPVRPSALNILRATDLAGLLHTRLGYPGNSCLSYYLIIKVLAHISYDPNDWNMAPGMGFEPMRPKGSAGFPSGLEPLAQLFALK